MVQVGDEAACKLAAAFISDFIGLALRYEWAHPVLATTEDARGNHLSKITCLARVFFRSDK